MNKASGGDGIPAELFRILKDDALKVLHSLCQQIWKIQQRPSRQKSQLSFQSQRGTMPNNVQTTGQLSSRHMLATAAAESRQLRLTLCDPTDGSPPGSPSLGFSRQEHWSGLPFPSPMRESEVAQSCPTLRDPTDCSPPGSSVHGILQARVLEWGAIAFSKVMLKILQARFQQ